MFLTETVKEDLNPRRYPELNHIMGWKCCSGGHLYHKNARCLSVGLVTGLPHSSTVTKLQEQSGLCQQKRLRSRVWKWNESSSEQTKPFCFLAVLLWWVSIFLFISTHGHYPGTPSKILRKSISDTLFSAGSFILFKHRSGINNDNLYGLR